MDFWIFKQRRVSIYHIACKFMYDSNCIALFYEISIVSYLLAFAFLHPNLSAVLGIQSKGHFSLYLAGALLRISTLPLSWFCIKYTNLWFEKGTSVSRDTSQLESSMPCSICNPTFTTLRKLKECNLFKSSLQPGPSRVWTHWIEGACMILVLAKSGSVRFFTFSAEPRTGLWVRFSYFSEPGTEL